MGDRRSHQRVLVECEPLPTENDLDSLKRFVEDAKIEVAGAQEKFDDADDALDEAQGKLSRLKARLTELQRRDSARDFPIADDAAIAALPVI